MVHTRNLKKKKTKKPKNKKLKILKGKLNFTICNIGKFSIPKDF